MCSEPLSTIWLKPVGVFPEHFAVLALVFGLSISYRLLGFKGLHFFALLFFFSLLPLSSTHPSTGSFFHILLVLSLLFHPILPTPRKELRTYMTSLRIQVIHWNCCQHNHSHPHALARQGEKNLVKIILDCTSSSNFGIQVSQCSSCHDERFLLCCQQQQVPKYL